MIDDPLLIAAERLGVPLSAGAGGPGEEDLQIWARWPRDRLEIAHDTLERVMELEDRTEMSLDGRTGMWRARCGKWTFTGPFDEAVAMVALHVSAEARNDASRTHAL